MRAQPEIRKCAPTLYNIENGVKWSANMLFLADRDKRPSNAKMLGWRMKSAKVFDFGASENRWRKLRIYCEQRQ